MINIPPAALMDLETYLKQVSPILKEYKDFLKKNKGMFTKAGYNGLEHLTYDEYYQRELQDYAGGEYAGASWIEEAVTKRANERFGYNKQIATPELLATRDEFQTKLMDLLGGYYEHYQDRDIKSNKFIIRWAIDYKIYVEPIKNDEIQLSVVEAAANSVGVRVPKNLLDEQKRKEIIKGKLNPLIKSTIDELGKQFWEKAKADELDRFERTMKAYEQAPDKKEFKRKSQTYRMIEGVSQAELNRMAEMTATLQVQGFIHKMYDKFGGLLPSKECVKSVDFDGGLNINTFKVELVDGTKFRCENNIITNWSVLGNPYYQFPTTFSGLVLPNGVTMNQIGEADLKKHLNAGQQ